VSGFASEIQSDSFYGGLLQRHGGQMHMGKFTVGLADAAVRRGAKLYENAAVTAIAKDGSGFKVTTQRGEVRAKQVLIATGPSRHGRSAGIGGGSRRSVRSSW
jgi:Glycine/D-amino acid oxidases (deaminating)